MDTVTGQREESITEGIVYLGAFSQILLDSWRLFESESRSSGRASQDIVEPAPSLE